MGENQCQKVAEYINCNSHLSITSKMKSVGEKRYCVCVCTTVKISKARGGIFVEIFGAENKTLIVFELQAERDKEKIEKAKLGISQCGSG